MMRGMYALAAGWLALSPVEAQEMPTPIPDAELASMTGKFILPGGGSLALSVTSDTLLNGTLVLRTVLTVDHMSNVQVFARGGDVPLPDAGAETPAAASTLTGGASVLFDRRTGAQITVPTISTIRAHGAAGAGDTTPAGLVPVAVVPGAAAVRTPDGLVSITALPNGTQVSLAGDSIGIAHLVGQSVATAILNAGNDRTIDTVTTIGIDLHDAAALTLGSAAMKVDALATDAARGMIR